MRFARHPALIAAFLALFVLAVALSWPVFWPTNPEVSTERLVVNGLAFNGPVPRADRTPGEMPPFRCDSIEAQDCFEMFQRYQSRMTAMTTVAAQPALDRPVPSKNESTNCTVDVFHRGDRCMIRSR